MPDRLETEECSFAFEDTPDISFAMQDAKNMQHVFFRKIINANGFKSDDRPGAEMPESRIVGQISRARLRVVAQRLDGTQDRFPEAIGNFWDIGSKLVIAELPHDIIAGSLPIENLHEREPDL